MGERKQPTPAPANQTKPDPPPPAPPPRRRATDRVTPAFMPGRDRRIPVRSKASGREGFAYPDDPHVWVEGPGIAGWYRLESIGRDFITEDEK